MADRNQVLDAQPARMEAGIPGPAQDTRAVTTLADGQAAGITSPQAVAASVRRSAEATPWGFADLLALEDFERHAKRHLPPMVYQYVAGAQGFRTKNSVATVCLRGVT